MAENSQPEKIKPRVGVPPEETNKLHVGLTWNWTFSFQQNQMYVFKLKKKIICFQKENDQSVRKRSCMPHIFIQYGEIITRLRLLEESKYSRLYLHDCSHKLILDS